MSEVAVRPAVQADMVPCADILNAWIDATEWMPRVHTAVGVRGYYREVMFTEREMFVTGEQGVTGFLALQGPDMVGALYVAEGARGQGAGTSLLDCAKVLRPRGLKLWTFVENTPARAFYQKNGFVEAGRTDGDNEEGLADILFVWDGGS